MNTKLNKSMESKKNEKCPSCNKPLRMGLDFQGE